MKKKFSLFLNIATICLCVCAIAIGVWSAKRAELAISGNIGFTANNCDVVATTYIQNAMKRNSADTDWEQIGNKTVQWCSDNNATADVVEYVTDGASWNFGSIYFDDWFNEVASTIRIKIEVANYSTFPVSARLNTLTVDGVEQTDFDNIYHHKTHAEGECNCNYVLVALHNDYIKAGTKNAQTGVVTPFEDQMVIEITLKNHQEKLDLQNFDFGIEFAQTQTPSVEDGYEYSYNEDLEANMLTAIPEYSTGSKHITLPNQLIDEDGSVVDIGYVFGDGDRLPGLNTYDEEGELVDGYYSVTLTSGLDFVEQYELYNSFIYGVLLSDSVTVLDYTFDNCLNLLSITIPASVEIIGGQKDALRNEHGLLANAYSLFVEEGNEYYYSKNNCIISKLEPTKLVAGCNTSVIPNFITTICNHAFSDCVSLGQITIPDSVTSIGYSAFYGCTSLTQITIPDSVTSIDDHAFYECTSLTQITIPDSVTSIGEWAFADCTSLTSITIPDSVTSIGDNAFSGCTSLTSVEFENINGWRVKTYSYPTATTGTAVTVKDGSTAQNKQDNANLLKATYRTYYWARFD